MNSCEFEMWHKSTVSNVSAEISRTLRAESEITKKLKAVGQYSTHIRRGPGSSSGQIKVHCRDHSRHVVSRTFIASICYSLVLY